MKPGFEFEVGDICRIRDWEDMADEFGVGDDGNIYGTEVCFMESMKPLCGRVFTVASKRYDYGLALYTSEERAEFSNDRTEWMITTSMLEPYQPVSEPIVAPGDFLSLFN